MESELAVQWRSLLKDYWSYVSYAVRESGTAGDFVFTTSWAAPVVGLNAQVTSPL